MNTIQFYQETKKNAIILSLEMKMSTQKAKKKEGKLFHGREIKKEGKTKIAKNIINKVMVVIKKLGELGEKV